MQITDVRVRRIDKEGKMKAVVSITLDNEFVIHDIKVIIYCYAKQNGGRWRVQRYRTSYKFSDKRTYFRDSHRKV